MQVIRSEPQVFTIGHYAPDGTWQPVMDCSTATEALEILNGTSRLLTELNNIREELNRMATPIELIEARYQS